MEKLLLKVTDVSKVLSMGVSTIWQLTKTSKDFPKPVKIGPATTRWKSNEIEEWAKGRGI